MPEYPIMVCNEDHLIANNSTFKWSVTYINPHCTINIGININSNNNTHPWSALVLVQMILQ